jgi:copper resistance protein B
MKAFLTTLALLFVTALQADEMPGMQHDMHELDRMGHAMPMAVPAEVPTDEGAANRILPRGEEAPPVPMAASHDQHRHGESAAQQVLFDRLEYLAGRDDHGLAWEADAWWGGDTDKLWLQSEGERVAGESEGRAELLWSHAVAAFWDSRLGLRHDFGSDTDRQWLAFGVAGTAPWWFDLEASAYFGPNGRSAARLNVERELQLSRKLVLAPQLELDAYGKDDRARDIGSGLAEGRFGLRLRYEITPRFAPYLGLEWSRRFGESASLAEDRGDSRSDSRLLAGVRFWF